MQSTKEYPSQHSFQSIRKSKHQNEQPKLPIQRHSRRRRPNRTCSRARLHLADIDFVVLERRPAIFEDRGASLIAQSQTFRVLHQFGILDELLPRGAELKHHLSFTADGHVFSEGNRYSLIREDHGHGPVAFHRSQLIEIMYNGLPEPAKEKILTDKQTDEHYSNARWSHSDLSRRQRLSRLNRHRRGRRLHQDTPTNARPCSERELDSTVGPPTPIHGDIPASLRVIPFTVAGWSGLRYPVEGKVDNDNSLRKALQAVPGCRGPDAEALTGLFEKYQAVRMSFVCSLEGDVLKSGLETRMHAVTHSAGTAMDLEMDEVFALFQVNVFAVMRLCQFFVPLLRQSPRGRIVQIGSVTRSVPVVWQSAYNASKAARSQISRTLRLEVKPLGIEVIGTFTEFV